MLKCVWVSVLMDMWDGVYMSFLVFEDVKLKKKKVKLLLFCYFPAV